MGARARADVLVSCRPELIADAVRAQTLECERVGEDLLVSARMKEW